MLKPKLVLPDEGAYHEVLGDRFRWLLTPMETGGRFCLMDYYVPPGNGTPPHIHHREDEIFTVLDGQITWHSEAGVRVGSPGDCAFLPRGRWHCFRNSGSGTLRTLVWASGSNFHDFLMSFAARVPDLAQPQGPPTESAVQAMLAAAGRFGLEMLPPQELPASRTVAKADRRLAVLGTHVDLKLTSEDSGGVVSTVGIEVLPGGGPPPHVHDTEDEVFWVLDGALEVLSDGRWLGAEAGSLVYVPQGTVHTFRNAGGRAVRLLSTHWPGGFERFFVAASEAPLSQRRLVELMERHGMRVARESTASAC